MKLLKWCYAKLVKARFHLLFFNNLMDVTATCFAYIGGTRQHTQKTVAMAVGIVAAVGFVLVLLLFARSVMKKKRTGKYEGH